MADASVEKKELQVEKSSPKQANVMNGGDEAKTDAPSHPNNTKKKKRKDKFWERKDQKKRACFERNASIIQKRGSWRDPTENSLQPNKGSFADPVMQRLFNVQVPREQTAENVQDKDGNKRAKRKIALLLGFLGTKYSGFQINPERHTLQAELELALYRAHFILDSNFGFPHKYSWSNSARTDKGVHACAQVCSSKLLVGDLTTEEIQEQINAQLPSDIRVLDVKRVTRAFCAKTARSRARYMYLIPSFLLFDRGELRALFEKLGCPEKGREARDPLSQEEIDQLRPVLSKYRATPKQLEKLREALQQYEGTLPFHNFTKSLSVGEPSATRFILSFKAGDPVVLEDGTEWIPTQVLGQSFLLNQIRKMISLAVDVVRGTATREVLAHALGPNTVRVGVAPAQGLFLEMSDFHAYNQKKRHTCDLDGLDWIDQPESPAMQRWKTFKEDVILRHIMNEEKEQGNFIKYLFEMEYFFTFEENYNITTAVDADDKQEATES